MSGLREALEELAEHQVQHEGDHRLAQILATHPAEPTPPVVTDDTLPQWLYQRFRGQVTSREPEWGDLHEVDRKFWKHEANAVRRAVARDGFRQSPNGAS